MDKNTIKALLCSNKLLNICDKELLNKDLSYNIIDNLMFLIEMSVDLHNLNFKDDDYEWYYYMIGKKRASEYNVDFANIILNKFYEKLRNTKVIKLY